MKGSAALRVSKPLTVYEFNAPEGYDWVQPVREQDFDLLRFDGTPRGVSWKPIRVRRLEQERGKRSDFPLCSGDEILLVRERAIRKIGPVLAKYGELLPLHCPGDPVSVLNVTRLIPALDESKSEILRSRSRGDILMLERVSFHPEAIGDAHLFKLAEFPQGAIYVTTAFVDLVKEHKLEGLTFDQVWPLPTGRGRSSRKSEQL